MMDRRTFLTGTGAVLLATPLVAEAQQAGKVYRIGGLETAPMPLGRSNSDDSQWRSGRARVVSGLAHPGANVTGLTSLSSDLYAKRVQLLKETIPRLPDSRTSPARQPPPAIGQ